MIQSDLFSGMPFRTILPLTSTLVEGPLLRVPVEPSDGNGLRAPSQIMIDKASTVPADKLGPAFGRLDDGTMIAVNRSLALFLGLAG